MGVNNEIGIIHPLAEIGKICRERGIYLHTDAAQALGKIKLDVEEMNIDLMSMTAHKMYGPKGIGALYVRRNPKVRISPLLHGGGQERGIRSGTLSPALVAGFGEACSIAQNDMEKDHQKIKMLYDRLRSRIFSVLKNAKLNGDDKIRFPGNINISFEGVDAGQLMNSLEEIALSSGSACNSACSEPSYVLMALGHGRERAQSSIRIGIGRFTTQQEIDYACDRIIENVRKQVIVNKGKIK